MAKELFGLTTIEVDHLKAYNLHSTVFLLLFPRSPAIFSLVLKLLRPRLLLELILESSTGQCLLPSKQLCLKTEAIPKE
jgi:hypothetical protein